MIRKYCRWCERTKPLEAFHKHAGMRDGRLNKCAVCVRAYVAEYQRRNPLRKVWQHMLDRCRRPSHRYWHRYGGRGIRVCERWKDYQNFVVDMSPTYQPGLELDRIDNDGDYEPGNCRWVSRKRQARNTSRNVTIEAQGKSLTIAGWAEETGIAASTIQARIRRLGWDPVRAVTTPTMSPKESADARWSS